MGNRSGGRAASPVGLVSRYRRVAFSLLLVAAMLTWAVAGTTILGAQSAPAGELSIGSQVGVTEVDSCTVIAEPGHYELTADVEGDGDACLHVRSDDVYLDGNGHTVSGTGSESGVGVLVFNGSGSGYPREGPAVRGVTIRDVEVNDWKRGVQAGVALEGGPTVTLRNVTATDDGRGVTLYGNQESELRNVTASNNDRVGLALWGTRNVTADGITARDNGGPGLSFSDTVVGSAFTDVTATDNAGHGVHVSTAARNNTVSDATVTNNDGSGVAFIDSTDNVVRDSTIADNAGPGIMADPADGDRVSNVTVSGNEVAYRNGFAGTRYGAVTDGLRLESGVVASFDRNVSSFNGVGNAPTPPRDVRVAGSAANLSMSDAAAAGSRATITFPYADEAVGNESTLSVFRYDDGDWRPVAATDVDTDNRTVTASVSESGVFVPVYAARSGPISGNESAFVVTATDAEEAVAYGFVVAGEVEVSRTPVLPPEDDEEIIEGRSDGTTVVHGTTGEDGGDTFVVTGEIVEFSTQPENASVELELDGDDFTDRMAGGDDGA